MSEYLWQEVLPELIEELDWSGITEDQWSAISEALDSHVSITHEHGSYGHPTTQDMQEMAVRDAVEPLKHELAMAEEMLSIHNNSVKTRRGATAVWVDVPNKSVMYE